MQRAILLLELECDSFVVYANFDHINFLVWLTGYTCSMQYNKCSYIKQPYCVCCVDISGANKVLTLVSNQIA